MLGDLLLSSRAFPHTESWIEQFKIAPFIELSSHEKFTRICRTLVEAISQETSHSFTLIPVLDFMTRVVQEGILPSFHFLQFETWLNKESGLSLEENIKIRGQIAGKWIPRNHYQALFPLGGGKVYKGPHFITAHASPDVDTTIASFWGWVDAFAARVTEGVHIWNVPGNTPPEHLEINLLFKAVLGNNLFSLLSRSDQALKVIAQDLFIQGTASSSAALLETASLEEIQAVLREHPDVTILRQDDNKVTASLGVITAKEISHTSLGTVSLRDFSNYEETKVPSYLEVISVLDHHKCHLVTKGAATISLSDAQSCNVLVAEKSLTLSDPYALGGSTLQEVQEQIKEIEGNLNTPSTLRIFQKLLQKLSIFQQNTPYFVAKEREIMEYLHYLYAILDDTDLLSKVTYQDVMCIKELLNRLKSLSLGREVEIIHFDDIKIDELFVKKAAERILQNKDMYSLYQKIYALKEQNVDEHLLLAAQGLLSNLWSDTKEQNGCCRIGQTKMFANNYALFSSNRDELYHKWQERASESSLNNTKLDLHLQMISTIAGAEEKYKGGSQGYTHLDELWIWTTSTQEAFSHLKFFLQGFLSSSHVARLSLQVESLGKEWETFIQKEFPVIDIYSSEKCGREVNQGIILRYPAAALNSRKAVISPYLPTLT
ncbi:hypothetical protein RSOCI_01350 [Rhabdochlamydiaceae symbiont of Dictyostelium giganteum]